jgi:hypothetical protein
MMCRRTISRQCFLWLTVCLCSAQIYAQPGFRPLVRNLHAEKTTALQFYWFGDVDSHFRLPMDFHVVAVSDPRFHKVEITTELLQQAAIAYISLREMQEIILHLSRSDADWNETNKLSSLRGRPLDSDNIPQVTIISSRGTSVGHVRIARMCEEFASYDALMPTKRILWQFQTMRWDNGCIIPGYHNEDAPPD